MSVHAKIVDVMEEVGQMKPEGEIRGSFGNYDYISEEQITSAIQRACVNAGLTIVPQSVEVLKDWEATTKSGSTMYFIRVLFTFAITDVEDGSSVVVQSIGTGSDMGDKDSNKAATGALKYALRQTFLISSGDDPDKVASQETTAKTKTEKTAKAQAEPQSEERTKLANKVLGAFAWFAERGYKPLLNPVAQFAHLRTVIETVGASTQPGTAMNQWIRQTGTVDDLKIYLAVLKKIKEDFEAMGDKEEE